MGIMVYGKETIYRDSADGIMPAEETNFLYALNILTEESTNENAIATVVRESSTFITPATGVLKEFQALIELSAVVSSVLNAQKIKNYPPYSAIVQNLWPVVTNTVIITFKYFSMFRTIAVFLHVYLIHLLWFFKKFFNNFANHKAHWRFFIFFTSQINLYLKNVVQNY